MSFKSLSKRPDLQKLPPLKSLIGFESAARLESIRGAAEELNLTHPAISHQIKSLEAYLDMKLFMRDGRNIKLTSAGKNYHKIVVNVLKQLTTGYDDIKSLVDTTPLIVQSYITISIKWLARRISGFKKLHPEIELHLNANGSHWQFNEEEADLGIIYNQDPIPSHLHWTRLFPSHIFPVCSPDLLSGVKLSPQELYGYPLLTVDSEKHYWSWDNWFLAIGLAPQKHNTIITVDTLAVAFEMACNGEGIALINGPVADAELSAGKLVKPVDHIVEGNGEWGLICRQDVKDNPRIKAFRDWLLQETQ